MRQVISGVSILCVFAMLFQGCKGEKHVAKAPSLAEMLAQLCDEEYTVRADARYKLREERNNLTRVLMDKLSRLSKTRDTDYEGPLHLTVEALGTWRIEGAVPVLVEMVDYQLDRATMPVGKKLPAYAYYPVAGALRTIGGVYVQRVIVKRLCAEDDAKVVRICVWVLFEAYG